MGNSARFRRPKLGRWKAYLFSLEDGDELVKHPKLQDRAALGQLFLDIPLPRKSQLQRLRPNLVICPRVRFLDPRVQNARALVSQQRLLVYCAESESCYTDNHGTLGRAALHPSESWIPTLPCRFLRLIVTRLRRMCVCTCGSGFCATARHPTSPCISFNDR